MYPLLIVALSGLALFKVIDVVEELVPAVTRLHALLTMVAAVAATMAMDYSMFAGFKAGLRTHWMETVATGLAVAGMTSVWRAMFHWLGSDEGETPAVRHPEHHRPRIAA